MAGKTPGAHKDQQFMMIGSIMCLAAALLSFFIGYFTGGARTTLIVLLLICLFGGIAFVGIGIRWNKRRKAENQTEDNDA